MATELATGDHVHVTSGYGGKYCATVVNVVVDENNTPMYAVVEPESSDLRAFFGHRDLTIGAAHWNHSVQKV